MIVNLTNKKYISRKPFFAVGLRDRLRGMIGRKFYDAGFDAMVFTGCNNIHTFFMSQRIDVIFLDIENNVVGLRKNLACWQLWIHCSNAVTTIELPAGTIEHCDTEIGDVINIAEESVPEVALQAANKNIVTELESAVPFKESAK